MLQIPYGGYEKLILESFRTGQGEMFLRSTVVVLER